ncbi:hypothetical protein DFJ73DRAFT_484057 [Zopfochytrium polystomum]|nr:hypothetical protein DFJ73DRAFT_484057 [Zopfochytrium polystomum]
MPPPFADKRSSASANAPGAHTMDATVVAGGGGGGGGGGSGPDGGSSVGGDFGWSWTTDGERLDGLVRLFESARFEDKDRAILEYADFFAEVQSEALVSRAALTLAEYWRDSNNILRQSIYKVFKLAAHHLYGLNPAEFTARVKVAMASNDPVARALTLRLYGHLSSILYDVVDVQHSVLNGLSSADRIEFEAALFAAYKVAPFSASFAEGIPSKVHILLKDGTDRRLVKLLGQTYQSRKAGLEAFSVCKGIVRTGSQMDMSRLEALRTMTMLASKLPEVLPEQIALLTHTLQRLSSDESVARVCLTSLNVLASRSSHAFSQDHAMVLASMTSPSSPPYVQSMCSRVMRHLSGHYAIRSSVPLSHVDMGLATLNSLGDAHVYLAQMNWSRSAERAVCSSLRNKLVSSQGLKSLLGDCRNLSNSYATVLEIVSVPNCIPEERLDSIEEVLGPVQGIHASPDKNWRLYKLATALLSGGHFQSFKAVVADLRPLTVSDETLGWMETLNCLGEAGNILDSQSLATSKKLTRCALFCHHAETTLKSISSFSRRRLFQNAYLQILTQTMECICFMAAQRSGFQGMMAKRRAEFSARSVALSKDVRDLSKGFLDMDTRSFRMLNVKASMCSMLGEVLKGDENAGPLLFEKLPLKSAEAQLLRFLGSAGSDEQTFLESAARLALIPVPYFFRSEPSAAFQLKVKVSADAVGTAAAAPAAGSTTGLAGTAYQKFMVAIEGKMQRRGAGAATAGRVAVGRQCERVASCEITMRVVRRYGTSETLVEEVCVRRVLHSDYIEAQVPLCLPPTGGQEDSAVGVAAGVGVLFVGGVLLDRGGLVVALLPSQEYRLG